MKSLLIVFALSLSAVANAQSVLKSCGSADGSSFRHTTTGVVLDIVNPKGNEGLVYRFRELFKDLAEETEVKISRIRVEFKNNEDTSKVLAEVRGSLGRVYRLEDGFPVTDVKFATGPAAAGPVQIGGSSTTVKLDATYARFSATAIILYTMTPITLDKVFKKQECREIF